MVLGLRSQGCEFKTNLATQKEPVTQIDRFNESNNFSIQRYYYVYNILLPCISAHQRRAPDLITDGCEPPCGCWELNSGPLEEQPLLLTTELSLQPLNVFLIFLIWLNTPITNHNTECQTLIIS